MRFRTTSPFLPLFVASFALLAGTGCSAAPSSESPSETSAEELRGPGAGATDQRVPELGSDLTIVNQSKISLAAGIAKAEAQGPVIEAKFELDDNQKLSLSLYPAGQPITVDAPRNVFRELSGDPTVSPFAGSLEDFTDQEHLTRSARDLTLIQLSHVSLASAVEKASSSGTPFWAIPTIHGGRAGYGVYLLNGTHQRYRFIDGGGSQASNRWHPADLGNGPGAKATDERVPELGSDLSVLRTSKISMADALEQAEAAHGAIIEAKFELGDDGKLSLSIYPTGKGVKVDAERNSFFELAGDPTANHFAPSLSEFQAPDSEHLTTSSRDLTLVQTAGLSLREAVDAARCAIDGGFVYWAVPTIRDTRAGYGVYVLGKNGKSHYLFIS